MARKEKKRHQVILMEWEDAFNLEIAAIDEQHRLLLQMLNSFYDAVISESTREEMEQAYLNLIYHMETHFQCEEDLFEIFSYPKKLEHTYQHAEFVKEIDHIKDACMAGITELEKTNLMFEYLYKLFINHIIDNDQEYVDFLDGRIK